MADSATVDIGGTKVKKNTLLIGGVAAAAVIIIAISRKKAAAGAASPASALVTDPAGNQCASFDPSTGYCPGTAADTAAQQANATAAGGVGGGGGYSYYTPATTATSSTGSAVPTFTDNASWAQYVETALGSNGADAVAAAIAKYLSGQPVTTDQQTTIEEGIAIAGYPPVTGANGNPPSMVLSSSTSSSSSSSTTSSSTTSSGNGVQSQADPPPGDVWVIEIPNGKGGWMNAVFPTGASVTAFYNDVGYDNGYPGGLTAAQITGALSRAGGSLQSPAKSGR